MGLPSAGAAEKFAAEYLRLGVGARALGMGNAFLAVAQDPGAPYWNAANLPDVAATEVSVMHSERFAGRINYDTITAVFASREDHAEGQDLNRQDGMGVSFIRLGIDGIPITTNLAFDDFGLDQIDGTGDPGEGNGEFDPGERVLFDEGLIEYRSDAEYGLFAGYGRRLGPRWSLGGSLKLLYQNAAGIKSFGIGLDVALATRLWHDARAALRIADVTRTLLAWDTGRREWIEPTVRFGFAQAFALPKVPGAFLGAADLQLYFENRGSVDQISVASVSGDLHFGLEYRSSGIALRLGAERNELAAGAGFGVNNFEVDYAFVGHDVLGNSHRVSASMVFAGAQ